MTVVLTLIEPCPVCGDQPDIDRCTGGPGWYACCYKEGWYPNEEHHVGINADSRAEAVRLWNKEVRLIRTLPKKEDDNG